MVSQTMLYRGEPIADWPDCPRVAFTQYMGYEPDQDVYWGSQGTVTSGLPFVGGSRITSGFWSHESFRFVRWTLGPHGGIDLVPVSPASTAVHVLVTGKVVGNAFSTGAGNITTLELEGTFPRVYMDYAHMKTLPVVAVGDVLPAGTVLAEMGATGTFATGAHLHMSAYTTVTPAHGWEGFVNRRYLDPLPYLGDMFDPRPGKGITLTTFKGGLINLLDVEAQEHDIGTVSITKRGEFVVYVPGAPAFVNEEFVSQFDEGWVHAGTALLTAERKF